MVFRTRRTLAYLLHFLNLHFWQCFLAFPSTAHSSATLQMNLSKVPSWMARRKKALQLRQHTPP